MSTITLGQATEYPQEYAPEVLCPVARRESRQSLGIADGLPFHGVDIWNAWELTWLDQAGKPVVATTTFRVDAASPNIVESKSLKLYLGSLAMVRFDGAADVESLIVGDLSAIAGSPVEVDLVTGRSSAGLSDMPGQCIDDLEMPASAATVDASLLVSGADEIVEESLHSHLLRSLCPVTGQPDYASVLVRYRGPRIDPATLLAYIVSYRTHQDFHEACVERMFCDIRRSCDTERLTVYARYTRRGGIDINPFRSDFEDKPENLRLWRQ